MIDWSLCPDVERSADTLSGAWRIKETRIPVQAILDNAEDCTPEEIAGPDIYPDLSVDVVRRILAFAGACPPPLMFGEGEPTALLLQMVLHHCGTAQRGELDSHGIAANDEAMRALHESGDIEITAERDERIFAKVTPDGWTLLDSLRAERQRRP